LIAILLICFFTISSENKVQDAILVKANFNNIYRQIFIKENWSNWLVKDANKNSFIIKECEFSFLKSPNENVVVVQLKNDKQQVQAYYQFTQLAFDSILVKSEAIVKAKTNWITDKISAYFFAKKVDNALKEFIAVFKSFAEDKKQFYGLTAALTKLPDSCMIAKKAFTANYPTTYQIYKEIEVLQQYALANNAIAIKPPMLNVKQLQPFGFEFMVSLPVNKRLAGKGDILFKQMLPYGNYLESDSIIGDQKRVDSLFISFENYKNDYNFTSPAIPFQSLVTNRLLVKDSTKWVTKFYFPVF
jgi:hypothetical protein